MRKFTLRTRNPNISKSITNEDISSKRKAEGTGTSNVCKDIDEPKAKRQVLFDRSSNSNVCSYQPIIKSTAYKNENTCGQDILRYFKIREKQFKIGDYLLYQPFITNDNRSICVDWMVEVQDSYGLSYETLYLSVKLVDRYLDRKPNVLKEDIQLLAGASLFISAKFEEVTPLQIDEIIYSCADTYTQMQLLKMERNILSTVGFDLGMPTSYKFLCGYFQNIKMDRSTRALAQYVLEISLMFYEFVHIPESLMATASLLLAIRMKNLRDLFPILQLCTGYELTQVEPLMYCLNHMVIKYANFDGHLHKNLKVICGKYSHKLFYDVASIPPLESPIPSSDPIHAPSELNLII